MAKKPETLLQQRMKQWGVEAVTFQPMDDNVVVWRLPPITETAGGLVIPLEHATPHVKGLLLRMGPRAMDILKSNGIDEGHYVLWARYAGWETNDDTPESRRHSRVLMIKARDIIGSDDLAADLKSGRAKYVKGDDGRWRLERKLLNGRKEKLLALAADPGATPAERETARKRANEIS